MTKKEKQIKEGKLEEGKQKALRALSRVLEILARIGRVCLWIGVVCLIILAAVFPIVAKNITVSKEEISYKDKKIELKENEEKLDIVYNGKVVGNMKASEKEAVYKIIDKINEKKIGIIIEIALIIGVVALILTIIMMNYAIKIFKNLHKKSTPFVEENVTYIRKIGYFMIASFVVAIIGSGIVSVIAFKSLDFSFDVLSIGEILIVFVLAYVVEYGCKLQSETDATVYDEEE